MPKQLITIIGLIVSLGVIALGVVMVALPMWAQSVAVDVQTATVASTNSVYRVQVQGLESEQERQAEIDASVAALREQIPMRPDFDDVFEVISRAAESSGVLITSATAGEPTAFAVRRTALAPGEIPAPVEEVVPTEPTDAATTPEGTAAEIDGSTAGAASDARQQVDFAISVTANDMAQVTEFLDALRAGPRLLDSITAIATQTGTGVALQVSALTFIDSEE